MTTPAEAVYGTRRMLTAAIALVVGAGGSMSGAQNPTRSSELRIGVITPRRAAIASERSAFRGIRVGAAEAKQTARLFGSDVEVYEADGDGRTRGAIAAANFLAARREVQVLVGTSASDADSLSRFAESRGLIFLNIASRSEALRAKCRRHSFHIEVSDATYLSALGVSSRDPSRPMATAAPPGAIVLWDESLERFGASQVNDRFRAATGVGMDGPAWAGWVAIKIVTEAALRAKSTRAAAILKYLEQPSSTFDGHKGWQLGFRATDHQLRQPLYMVVRSPSSSSPAAARSAAAQIEDVPDLRGTSGAAGQNPDSLLDRIIPEGARCRWSAG